MTLRAMGALNGVLPEPTKQLVAFMYDKEAVPHVNYCQFVPAPEVNFQYFRLDPDEAVRMVDVNAPAWGYDDYAPTGRAFTVKMEAIPNTVQRWCFPYQVGEATLRVWQKSGIDTKMIYDQMRAGHLVLHRSYRIITALQNFAWGASTASVQTIMGSGSAFFDRSSGTELNPDGTPNPNFQIIKRTLQYVKRLLFLQTNTVLKGPEMIWVISPVLASAIATSGEIVNALKQSQFAKELTNPNLDNWSLPESYAGWKIVVECTPRVIINQTDSGTVASVTTPNQRVYMMNNDTSFFVSRPGGLQGAYGQKAFSTVQLYHFGGEARTEGRTEPWHELVEGRHVTEDRVVIPTNLGGFMLTGALSSIPAF
jgi:hypothetical protein